MKQTGIYHERIEVAGIVQGVGFRPFVYQLARDIDLDGSVRNHAGGVTIELIGDTKQLDRFAARLESEAPPLSQITSVSRERIPPTGDEETATPGFRIETSRPGARPTTLIAPDACVCEDCLREMFNPADRRYLYPFINCTNCGPRFTIIRSLPYDRPATTMAAFTQCVHCQGEYDNPDDRRFHAQPNACAVCGPVLTLFDQRGNPIAGDPIAATISLLRDGRIVAIKGLGGFHLAVDATRDDAVRRLRQRKRREEKPLAVMVGTRQLAAGYLDLTANEESILTSRQRPILLSRRKTSPAPGGSSPPPIAPSVAPDNPYLGVMLPYSPLHYLLLFHPAAQGDYQTGAATLAALVMTSANLSEEPICKDNHEAIDRLGGIADAYLTHNRDIFLRCDDSVVTVVGESLGLQRRSRGYAPQPIYLAEPSPPILAFGAEQKNTLCLVDGRRAFVSQHIGDLEQTPTLAFFEEAVAHFTGIFALSPSLFAYDLHPEYLSTRYFNELWRRVDPAKAAAVGCQHHHAHLASVLAEHYHSGPVIGFSLDGTGYGPDKTIWGGEMLICTAAWFIRRTHFKPVPLPGGSAAIKAPWRMALSYLLASDPASVDRLLSSGPTRLPALNQATTEEIALLRRAIETNLNCPLTSSLGRLFDAVASLLNLKHHCAFEGQAAMMLEMIATGSAAPAAIVPIQIERLRSHAPVGWPELSGRFKDKQSTILDSVPLALRDLGAYRFNCDRLIRALVAELESGELAPQRQAALAAGFHHALIDAFLAAATQTRGETGIITVAISGGCWQNRLLRELFLTKFTNAGFNILANHLVPPNDGGISLGQAHIAATLERSLSCVLAYQ